MIYKEYKGLQLSNMAFGSMRLPIVNGVDKDIDEAATFAMVDEAINSGINYFDTAWGYHGGNSEIIMGKALKKYNREQFYIATKFPGYDPKNWAHVQEIFEKQLEKLQMSYFDFYLIHNVCEMNIDAYLDDEKYGIFSYLMEQKKNGRIKHLGFSVHGNNKTTARFLEKYGKYMEFCQVQLNYLDYELQEAKEKLEMIKEYDIPIWVMEPVRGGRLCNLTEEETAILKEADPNRSPVEWSYRFLQSFEEVKVVLSGSSNMEQLKENIRIFSEDKPLDEAGMAAVKKLTAEMLRDKTLPCTACKYCLSHCPKGLDIPEIISLYNEHAFTGGGFIAPMVLSTYSEEKKPSACIGCKKCEVVCPQTLKISDMMKDFTEKLK